MLKRSTYYLLLIWCVLFLNACQNGSLEERVSRQRSVQEVDNTFIPDFPEPNKSYIKSKQRVIHRFYKKFLNPNYFSGMFLVAKNGKMIYEQCSGFSNYRRKMPITPNTPIHVASISKVATALAVLRLVDQKLLILDEDVRTYLKHFPYKGITVRMLLNHRSGIPYYGYFTFKTWHLGKTLHNKDVLDLIKKHRFPLNFPPNRKFAYSNTNYALLALIVEEVTDKKFSKAMNDLIFDPLNMKHSFIYDGQFARDSISQSYNSQWVNQGFDYMDAVYGDKNMYTTARDLMRMDAGTYSTNFLSDSLRKQLYKGYSYEQQGKNNYGLGIRLKEMEGRDPCFFHSGWWHGNTGCYTTLRQDTVCIIAISNRYTQSVYAINRLSMHFGNYPFEFEEY